MSSSFFVEEEVSRTHDRAFERHCIGQKMLLTSDGDCGSIESNDLGQFDPSGVQRLLGE